MEKQREGAHLGQWIVQMKERLMMREIVRRKGKNEKKKRTKRGWRRGNNEVTKPALKE